MSLVAAGTVAAGSAIVLGALAPRTGTEVELGEAAGHLYALGRGAVVATTGVLMFVVRDQMPTRRAVAQRSMLVPMEIKRSLGREK